MFKMESFVLLPLFIISIAVVSHTLPQNDIAEDIAAKLVPQSDTSQAHRLPDVPLAGSGCRIKYETKFNIEEVESVRQECRQWTEQKCTTQQRPKCTHEHENVCETKYKQKCSYYSEKKCTDSWRNECQTREKDECNEYNRQIQVPYEEDECITRPEERCEKHWEERIKGGRRIKEWVNDPATCRSYDTTDCRPVTKHRTENEKYTKCEKVPYQHCDRVKDTHCVDVPKQECHDEPWQDCHDVTKEHCVQETWEECHDYPRQSCKDVHEKVPKQVSVQVPIRVCDNGIDDGLINNQSGGSSTLDGDFVFSDIIA